MIELLAVLAGAFGTLIGSFLNVVIYRLPIQKPWGMERSECPRCGHAIAWYDNIPLVSWLALLGRCRGCKGRISVRYPLVEALTGALFALSVFRVQAIGWAPSTLAFAVCAAFSSVVVAASFIDLDHKILPDTLTLKAGPAVALVGVLGVAGMPPPLVFGFDLAAEMQGVGAGLLAALAGAAVGYGIIRAIREVGTWILKKEAMGLGDAKFMAMAGLLLGAGGVSLAIAVGLVVGAVLGVLIWLMTRSREIPFGPFLAIGVLGVLFFESEIAHFVLEVYPRWVRGG